MSTLDDARAAAAAANQVVADLENPDLPADPSDPVEPTDFTASAISNADGSVVVTLTPTAPAAVSDEEGSDSSGRPTATDSEPAGEVSEQEAAGPQPTM
jgi:hypothetical protein